MRMEEQKLSDKVKSKLWEEFDSLSQLKEQFNLLVFSKKNPAKVEREFKAKLLSLVGRIRSSVKEGNKELLISYDFYILHLQKFDNQAAQRFYDDIEGIMHRYGITKLGKMEYD